MSCERQTPVANCWAVRGNLRSGGEEIRGGLSWFHQDRTQQSFDKHIIAKLSTFTRGEHHGGANSAVAMTEFNRTSRLSGACNSAAQTGNIKVPTCTPQVAVEELVESFKRYLSRTEFDSGLCGANH